MIYLTGVTKDLFLRKRMIQLIQMEACVYMRQILQSARMDVTISIIIWIKRRLFQLRLLIHQLAHSNFTAMSKIKTVIVLEKDLRSEEHTSELQSRGHLVCRLLLEKKKKSQQD